MNIELQALREEPSETAIARRATTRSEVSLYLWLIHDNCPVDVELEISDLQQKWLLRRCFRNSCSIGLVVVHILQSDDRHVERMWLSEKDRLNTRPIAGGFLHLGYTDACSVQRKCGEVGLRGMKHEEISQCWVTSLVKPTRTAAFFTILLGMPDG